MNFSPPVLGEIIGILSEVHKTLKIHCWGWGSIPIGWSFGPMEWTRFRKMPLQTGIPPANCLFVDALIWKARVGSMEENSSFGSFLFISFSSLQKDLLFCCVSITDLIFDKVQFHGERSLKLNYGLPCFQNPLSLHQS